MSKAIFKAAKQCQQVLEEIFDVKEPKTFVRVWPTTECWEVCCYGQRSNGKYVISIKFDEDRFTTEFEHNTKAEFDDHLALIMGIEK